MGWDGMTFNTDRLRFFQAMVWNRWNELKMSVVSDPIKVFVKQEPHKVAKIREGRFRLISAVSVVDTMVDRILYSVWHRKALANIGRTPCLLGWSPTQGGYRFLQRCFMGKKVLCLDKSMWDWTVDERMIAFWLHFVLNLPINPPHWWKHLVEQRFRALYRDAEFQFSDGVRVRQPGWGVQKSGCYLTLILNSVGQSFCHYLANEKLGLDLLQNQPYAIGDDTIQESFEQVEEYAREISEMGYRVKDLNILDYIEFAGFIVKDGMCWPAYWQKHCYLMQRIADDVLPQTLDSYQRLYAFEPLLLSLIHANLGKCAPEKVKSAWELQREFDGLY